MDERQILAALAPTARVVSDERQLLAVIEHVLRGSGERLTISERRLLAEIATGAPANSDERELLAYWLESLGGVSEGRDERQLLARLLAAGAGGATTLGLTTNLVAWWELDEASGNRADSHTNGLTLSDNSTVTSAAGIGGVGTAAEFTSTSSEWLNVVDALGDVTDEQSMSVVLWVYLTTNDVAQMLAGVGDTGDLMRFQNWCLRYESNVFSFSMANAAGTLADSASSTFGAPATATWYMLAGVMDADTDELSISVNGGAFVTTPGVTDTGGRQLATVYGIAIGRTGGANMTYTNGRIAKVGFWKDRALTITEVNALYNGGAGRTYAEL